MAVRTYEAITGFFVQDALTTSTDIGPIPDYFGLASKSWAGFVDEIDRLCSKSPDSVSHKVLFLARHGQGTLTDLLGSNLDNVAMIKYTQKEWDETWAVLDGDGELKWGPDPRLTPIGEEQARSAHAAWKSEIPRGIPVPQRYYCSPLTRAIRTLELTFEGILPAHLKPVILENCREHNGAHSCDKRRAKSEVQPEFPNFVFEEGFEDEDVTWTPKREPRENMERRAKLVLDRIFQDNHDDTYISVTAHSGWIKSVLRVVGREDYDIPTGGIIVVVVKGTVS